MIYSIERKYHGLSGNIPQIIAEIKNNTKNPELPKIFQLWTGAEFEDYTRNPAICASRSLDDGQHSDDGTFAVLLVLPDGSAICEDNIIRWTTTARGTLRHDPRFISHINSCEHDIDHHLTVTPYHCGRLLCPECGPYEVQYNATQFGIKLMTASKYARRTDPNGRYLQHVTVSPPPELYYKFLTLDGFQEMRRYAIKIASEMGILGGLIVFHPYRQNGINDDDVLPEDYNPVTANDGNKHHARFAPHFHIVGFGRTKQATKEYVQSRKGWIFKAIWDSKKTIVDVVATMAYIMSHVGLVAENSPVQPSRLQSVSWIGLCNSANLQYACEERVGEEQLCSECGANIVVHKVTHRNEDITLQGKLYKYQKYPVYTDSAHKALMDGVFEKYRTDPVGLLRYLDIHPDVGVCLLSSRDLDRRLSTPAPIYARIDNSLHIPDVFAFVHVPKGIQRKREKRMQKRTERERMDSDPEREPAIIKALSEFEYDESYGVPSMDIAIFRMEHYPDMTI